MVFKYFVINFEVEFVMFSVLKVVYFDEMLFDFSVVVLVEIEVFCVFDVVFLEYNIFGSI